ncbi:MAG: hypothetical protein GWP08_18435 [Nitrospiraceae bacterium]|nr:hypothetical protein [Nitrospiraceae bacterium]
MSIRPKRVALRFLLFALFGLLLEVFLSSIIGFWKGDITPRGHTSVWMVFDYGLLGVLLMPMARPLMRWGVPLPARAFVYMLAIFAVEYVSGVIFTALGMQIWNDSWCRWNIHDHIALDFAPVWYALGLIVEFLYGKFDAMALVAVRGLTADDIERIAPE